MEKIKIAIAENHTLFREGIISMLEKREEFLVVVEAENGKVLIEKLYTNPVDIILLDLEMPIMGGFEAIEIVKEKFPEVKVLILTMHDDDGTIARMIERGANGFLIKDDSFELVFEAIVTVIEKDYYFTPRIILAIEKFRERASFQGRITTIVEFTKREREILNLICHEYSTREIACKLNTSIRTVDWHRKNIFLKTNSKNSAGMVFYAVKNGLID